jgi:hypothetical protein
MHREEVKDHALPTKSNLSLAAATSAFVLLALSSLAHAQAPDVTCKPTETQAECHARLKCKPYEELEDCQKRLKAAKPAGGGTQNNDANNQGNQGNQDNNDRGNRDNDRGNRDNDRGDRDNDRGNRDNDRSNRDHDRGDRGDQDNDRGSRGSRGDRGRSRRQRGSRGQSKGFEANKTFGLGLELGEPTGLTGKYFLSPSGALDFGVGWIYQHYYYGDGLNLYADYLWHPTSLVSAEAFELPFYVGVGLRFWSFDYCDRNPNPDICYRGSSLGVRIPLGIAFDFNNVPLDIFFQLVPVIDFVNGDYYDRYGDRAHVGIDFSAGIRFWFK